MSTNYGYHDSSQVLLTTVNKYQQHHHQPKTLTKSTNFGTANKLNIPYYRKVMKFPLKLLKTEFENIHGQRNPEFLANEEFAAVIEAVNVS